MDGSEAIAEKFLRSIGCCDLVHEPDGNVAPDFSIGGTTAVEVRRLNQADWSASAPLGLEILSYPLADRVQALLREFGAAQGRSYWVSYTFFRPIASWKEISPALRASLLEISQAAVDTSSVLRLHPSIEFRIDLTSSAQDQMFNLGTFSDAAAGGAVVAEMIRHIEHYVEEKARKIEPHKERYARWWLVLVDYIGYGLHPHDQDKLRRHVQRTDCFEKVFVVDPHSPHAGFEV